MSNKPWQYVLFPGRHHTLTKYQAEWINGCKDGRWNDSNENPIVTDENTIWIFAITSSNHHTTRRNPVQIQRRISQIELFGNQEDITVLITSLPDVTPNERFAEHVISAVHADLGITLTPDNTLVAVSTVIGEQYKTLGYPIGGIENDASPEDIITPWQLVEDVARGNKEKFNVFAHPSSKTVWEKYDLFTQVKQVFSDGVVSNEDGALTDTRAYSSYAQAFEESAQRKWSQISSFVVPGRILDIGCATGQLLIEAGRDIRFSQSDLIGIEPDRWLHAKAVNRAEQGEFDNVNTFFYRKNILNGDVFAPKSIDTTITAALTHEIYSYGNEDADLDKLTSLISSHTRPGGVWINLDVCGPANGNQMVTLKLNMFDGKDVPIIESIENYSASEIQDMLGESSTWSRLRQFHHDWPIISKRKWSGVISTDPMEPGVIRLSLKDAMEFMLHKDYTDNWCSELHESFTYRDWDTWVTAVTLAGFTVAPGSGTYVNEWIVANRFDTVATLMDLDAHAMAWPAVHMCLVAEKN